MSVVSDTLKIMTYMVPVWVNYGPRDHSGPPLGVPGTRVEEYPYRPGECTGKETGRGVTHGWVGYVSKSVVGYVTHAMVGHVSHAVVGYVSRAVVGYVNHAFLG